MKAKTLFKNVALVLVSAMLLSACTAKESPAPEPDPTPVVETSAPVDGSPEPTPKPPTVMGEDFETYYTTELSTLNYLVSNKAVNSEEGFCHFVDGLVQHDKFSALTPAIAKSWESNEDGSVWTVHMRDDVDWYTNDGKFYAKTTANDYVTAMELILDPAQASETVDYVLDFIAGAREYYDGTTDDIATVGVKAIDDFTIEYTLTGPTPFFPSLLTYSSYLPVNREFLDELGDWLQFGTDMDKILYNGSFLFSSWARDSKREYVKNPNYYQEERIHVGKITYIKVDDTALGYELFKRGEIKATALSTTQAQQAMADPEYMDYVFQTVPTSASWIFGMNSASPNKDFAAAALNKNFRMAMFHAFDSQPLLMIYNPIDQTTMRSGLLHAPDTSVTPEGRDYTTFGDLPEWNEFNKNGYNVELARQYMEKAREELGSSISWPITMRMPVSTAETSQMEFAVVRQLYETAFPNILRVEPRNYATDQYYNMMDEGDYEFMRSGWSADYADPSTYLQTILPGNDVDRFGYGNFEKMPEFVRLYNEALAITDDMDARFEKFAEAEALLYDERIIITWRYNGGGFALNTIQNPWGVPRSGYGLTNTMMLDRVYGKEPLKIDVRNAQRAEYEQEKAAKAAGR